MMPTELPRFIHERTRARSQQVGYFFALDNINRYQRLLIEGAFPLEYCLYTAVLNSINYYLMDISSIRKLIATQPGLF